MRWNLIVNHLEHSKPNLLIFQSIVITHSLLIFGDYKINKNDSEEILRMELSLSNKIRSSKNGGLKIDKNAF